MSVEKLKSDVTLLIDGQEFHCLIKDLSHHSTYFQSMFFSSFAEKDKKKIGIKGVAPEDFQLFLNAISGGNSISDENIENALALSTFLGSPELEKKCLDHLAQGSEIPLKEQFQLAEIHNSENLMIQVCSSIKDAYELDEVVPKDLDSFCNRTKNIVLQRSFELLGIRKAPLPPQPEEPVLIFEGMMSELLDQADLQNHHGMILADQAVLLRDNLAFEEVLDVLPEAKSLIQQDPRILELMEELRNTHSPAERNAVRAQIQVVKVKNMCTTLTEMGVTPEHPSRERTPFVFDDLYRIVHRNRRDHSKPDISIRGELLIDIMYRRIIETVKERLATEAPLQNIGLEPIWVTKINRSRESFSHEVGVTENLRRGISDSFRKVSDESRFQGLMDFVQRARECFFMNLIRKGERNRIQNQAERNMQE